MNSSKGQLLRSWNTIFYLFLLLITQDTFTQGVLFQNTGGDTLVYIEDEGVSGSIKLKNVIAAPSDPADKLYNVGGDLHWGTTPISHLWNKNGNDVYYNEGKVGIGEMAPTGDLEVNGVDGVVFKGTFGSGTIPATGSGQRLMWYPSKAALRAGYVDGNNWDDINIGYYSVGIGLNAVASGSASIALGYSCEATNRSSKALGWGASATGEYSNAIGYFTNASGDYSTALGSGSYALGEQSMALGSQSTASGFSSTSIGYGIKTIGSYSLGIALDNEYYTNLTQANTMAIMGGKVGINTIAPGENLVVKMGGPTWTDPHFAIENHNTTDKWDMTVGTGNKFFFGYNEASRVVVDTSGKVGVGTTSPEATIEILSSGTTEDPLRVRVGTSTKFRLWASNGSVSMGTNVIGPDDGLLVRGNVIPRYHKDADLGADGIAWDDIYYDDLHNQGASAFEGRDVTIELIKFPPLPKKPGSFDYLTENGDVELDPASMPPGLADDNSLLTDEISSFNYKANYEQQLQIEKLHQQVKVLNTKNEVLKKELEALKEMIEKLDE